jgi:RecB family exonuclease
MPDATAADLLAYLRTPGLFERVELVDRLEVTVLREGLRAAAEARERSDLRLGEIDALRDSEDRLGELERHARRLFAAPRRAAAAVLDPDEEIDGRALAVLSRSLADLRELGVPLSGADLIELVGALPVRIGARPAPGAVLVCDPLEIRAQRFHAVFVCGLQEGAFPAPGAPEPFLSDERRRELAAASGLRLRPREDALARERYLFYSCLNRATGRLVLSYRSSDEEGNIELRSPFIDDVADLFVPAFIEGRRRRLLADVVWGASDAPTAREVARAQAAAGGPVTSVDAPPAVIRRLSAAALSHVRHREILSAGALESYADCPVKWLVERELQPEELRPDSEPMVRGSFMHAVLERLLSRLGGPVTPSSLPEARKILAELLAEPAPELAKGRPDTVRRGELESIEADLTRYLEHEATATGGWRPQALEQRFGFDEDSLPPLQLDDDVRVRGLIDRIDVDDAGHAIVRDYKTGASRAAYYGSHWSDDRQLQVALYMLAVRELLGLEPVAGLYQPLGADDLRGRGVFRDDVELRAVVKNDCRTAEELGEVLSDARARAIELAARLRSGELQPCPETCSRNGCAFPGICRSG